VGEVVGELLRVSSVRAEHAEAGAGQPPSNSVSEPGAGETLRAATRDLVHCCLRRLEASEDPYDDEEASRTEEAAERLVGAAASVGHDAMLLMVREVCSELEQGVASGAEGAPPDLSRLAAALALAHAIAARPRALRVARLGAMGSERGLDALTRGVTRALAALEQRAADFAPGKRGLQAKSVAAHAQHCLGMLSEIKPQAAAARA
jgi:hypothetical protein